MKYVLMFLDEILQYLAFKPYNCCLIIWMAAYQTMIFKKLLSK